jgi:hypothetical protein
MAKYHYDLTGAEPIVRDMAVYDAATLVKGEFVILDSTAASNCRLITADGGLTDAAGIMNETITTTSKADPGDAITTAATTTEDAISSIAATLAQGHRYGKVIINPFAIFLTEYSQAAADDVALTQAWSTTTLTLTSLEDNLDGGWIMGASASTTSGFAGQLRYIDTSASGSCTVTVAPTTAGTTNDTIIKILPVHSIAIALNAGATDLLSAAAAGSDTGTIVENYISSPDRPLQPMKVGNLTRSSTTDTALDLGSSAKAYADILLHDHIYNKLS